MNNTVLFLFLSFSILMGNVEYNHPELNWSTFETEHFKIHFHDETEKTAREAATVAELIYPKITEFYNFSPKKKTHLILIDPDDYSNGAAYYYDNKIMIWASPLDFDLRGSHRWLQNVITHEFAHIVSLQKSMKAGIKFPGAYFQFMNYEDEKRPDVLYGYPNAMISYPIPGTVVPPWLAEGIAQYMYDSADWDNWDSHRDMVLRERAINNDLLSFTEMNTFGKKGIGNESTYNAGFALATYIANEFGSESIMQIMDELSNPLQFSVDNALENVLGISGQAVYSDFQATIKTRYKRLVEPINLFNKKGLILHEEGTTNIYPKWNPKKNMYSYLSNKNNDYFSQTDLFVYDLDKKEETKIRSNVYSVSSWHVDGETIYFSKRSKYPNKHGSRYFDIYSYNLATKEEERLTKDKRAFNPVFIEKDSSLAFIATYDGGQDLYILDLKTKSIKKITDFSNRPMISHLTYDKVTASLYFDITEHHFRNIYKYDLSKKNVIKVENADSFDERNYSVNDKGFEIFSKDQSGIFNLFMRNKKESTSGYITNVTGGAFMADISDNGNVLYSVYENGSYKIALLKNLSFIDELNVGYAKDYYLNNSGFKKPITELNNTAASTYRDQFPDMFIMPKIMFDYGTIKPGFYFYSSEIINRLSLFGGVSVNQLKDLDLFFIFDFKRLYPTLFFETYFLTRNTTDKSKYKDIYNVTDDIKFRLVQFRPGIKLPFFGTLFEFSNTFQWYRAFIQEEVSTNEFGTLEAGAAYDYFKGRSFNVKWNFNAVKNTLNKNIQPSSGFYINTNIDIEKNQFIEGLKFSDSGTLTEQFENNDLIRLQVNGGYHREIPKFEKLTVSLSSSLGYITNRNADSFFHFYLGGLPGLKGYTFYSIKGVKSALFDATIRFPLFTQKHFKAKWIIFQNSTAGVIFQGGDAWGQKIDNNYKDFSMKKSVGVQFRINGFSFYNYPTAIEFEYHKPLNKFEDSYNEEKIFYGEDARSYFKILFDF